MRTIFIAAVLAAVPLAAQAPAMDSKVYVEKAAASDKFEIDTSRLALEKAQRADVKDFARMMIDHHTRSTAKLMSTVRSERMMPPAVKLDAEQIRMLGELRTTSGASFDTAYLAGQRKGHQAALALHDGYAKAGQNPALKAFATETRGVVQSHIEALTELTSAR
jgi:putative membrane protein